MSCHESSPGPSRRPGALAPFRPRTVMPDQLTFHQDDPDPPLLDAEAVAEPLGVEPSWVYAETRAGRFPHVRIGRYRRFRRGSVQAWIEAHEHGPVR